MTEFKIRRKPRRGRIRDTMRPKMRRKNTANNVSNVSLSMSTPSYYDLVMEDIEGFLQIVNAHASGLKGFLGLEEQHMSEMLKRFRDFAKSRNIFSRSLSQDTTGSGKNMKDDEKEDRPRRASSLGTWVRETCRVPVFTNNTTNPIPGSVYSAVILVAGVPWERSGGETETSEGARHHHLSRLNAATTDFGLRRTMRLTCRSAHACTPDAAATEHERATLQRPWCAPPPPFPFPSCPYPPVHVNAGSPCTRLHWMPTSPSSPSLRVHRRGGIDAVGECATIRVASALADTAPAPAPPALPLYL
ncbi:hypothetical protein B0H10DRAFT_1945685 [Mycena sp. CBHHK59/15]|nr:hypothetical protein B0H10DRAFT_1945685 [Mycena sp. CBHHK59/15]